ncbi:MAG: hypothetical protein ACD_20C00418G0007 [uncultured bacterium]|nr:MAG: hypothetical protein ACD_20C00418G0007 [uncultured bacterium]
MIEKFEKHELKNFYKQMVLLREFEQTAAEMYLRGKISGFTHLYIGQEAIGVGTISALFDKDYIVSAYREHGHAIAKGISPRSVMAELFGKETGCCHGLGGSMHLFDLEKRFMGGYAIVGGGIPIAVGLGLAINYKKENAICVCFFGDGAVNQGAFHESLNLAKLWNLPVLFICENNLYAMGTEVMRASSVVQIAKRAQTYDIPSECVNGMDVLKVHEAVENAAKWVRSGAGPYFIEAKTYRYRAHSMADPGRYRTLLEEEVWKERDPIDNFAKRLVDTGLFDSDELKEIKEDSINEVNDSVKFADESPDPKPEMLCKYIYAEK